MTDSVVVRRVRPDDWAQVRELRLEAVRDPDASIAFLSTPKQELARDEDFWRGRTADAALSDIAAQFVAVADDRWVGTATVLRREAVAPPRADVVGVYLDPHHRGTGILARLFGAAADWAAARGVDALTLDVHADNARAQAAYRKVGFEPTGATFTSTIGPELEMRWTRR